MQPVLPHHLGLQRERAVLGVDDQYIDIDTMMFGNPLGAVNDKQDTDRQVNCHLKFYWQRIGARIEPIIVSVATKTIRAGEELLCSYGTAYWTSWGKRALGRGIAYASLLPPQDNDSLLQELYEREHAIEWVRFDDDDNDMVHDRDGDVTMHMMTEKKSSLTLKHMAIDNAHLRRACAAMSDEIAALKAELNALKATRECADSLLAFGKNL